MTKITHTVKEEITISNSRKSKKSKKANTIKIGPFDTGIKKETEKITRKTKI
jgi:hypothetical protein